MPAEEIHEEIHELLERVGKLEIRVLLEREAQAEYYKISERARIEVCEPLGISPEGSYTCGGKHKHEAPQSDWCKCERTREWVTQYNPQDRRGRLAQEVLPFLRKYGHTVDGTDCSSLERLRQKPQPQPEVRSRGSVQLPDGRKVNYAEAVAYGWMVRVFGPLGGKPIRAGSPVDFEVEFSTSTRNAFVEVKRLGQALQSNQREALERYERDGNVAYVLDVDADDNVTVRDRSAW